MLVRHVLKAAAPANAGAEATNPHPRVSEAKADPTATPAEAAVSHPLVVRFQRLGFRGLGG